MLDVKPASVFLNAYSELHEKLDEGGDWNMRKASAVLRQFLLDEEPTPYLVNRDHRIKITFLVGKPYSRDDRAFDIWWTELLVWPGSGYVNGGEERLSRDHFLALKVGRIGPHDVSVKDLISYYANVGGGVHTGKPSPGLQEWLRAYDHHNLHQHWAGMTATLAGVGRVTVDAFTPLAKAVLEAR